MVGHPGNSMKEAEALRKKIIGLEIENPHGTESIQIFTPTPMTISTCMYYTGMDPYTLKKIYVPYSYNEKKKQKRMLFKANQED